MELDWYSRATVNMSSSSSSSSTNSTWRTNVNVSDPERQASRWNSLLNLIQDRGILRGSAVEECPSPRSNVLSPKQRPHAPQQPQLSPQCVRSLAGEGSLSSKSHICFACVLHHHD
ncbi:hypothetical protein MPTK1_8g01140 [Marchantia polymorpha subsp. ruderalis]|uniref:Uncharacterized protein n=2 Tax=Marchantia polymorpha TaxID=3197 RepID=A0A176VFF7_MARPO|nr:hypothetical protein AXG93_1847s1000 [Marchantia polymorpha subsp. ruderalis]PTQ36407.1 hypothetical protein MARPO_0064s0084 [Marchantia polymorpha]BBN18265.1 hypothetical protein Mp_8g01140 [Marchantia polymorpha subsp. ruderalis]|eukprot:PTQ36407.1 hypothetical protein MARPO_0064s0084 [Marchantia polymorpha]